MKNGQCAKCGRFGRVSDKSGLCRDCIVSQAIAVQKAAAMIELQVEENTSPCARCGVPIRQMKNGPLKVYCSDACKAAAMRERMTGECKVCHEPKVLNREGMCANCKRKSKTPPAQKGVGVHLRRTLEGLQWDTIHQHIEEIAAKAAENGTLGGGVRR